MKGGPHNRAYGAEEGASVSKAAREGHSRRSSYLQTGGMSKERKGAGRFARKGGRPPIWVQAGGDYGDISTGSVEIRCGSRPDRHDMPLNVAPHLPRGWISDMECPLWVNGRTAVASHFCGFIGSNARIPEARGMMEGREWMGCNSPSSPRNSPTNSCPPR